MKTLSANEQTISRRWYIVDAAGHTLGRLASQVAHVLRGKHKPTFTPHADTGDFVIVINAEKIKVTGKKETQKIYWRYTGYPGGERGTTVEKQREGHPERIVQFAVRGMLPKGPLGRKTLKKLKVYVGSQHTHTAQSPEPLAIRD